MFVIEICARKYIDMSGVAQNYDTHEKGDDISQYFGSGNDISQYFGSSNDVSQYSGSGDNETSDDSGLDDIYLDDTYTGAGDDDSVSDDDLSYDDLFAHLIASDGPFPVRIYAGGGGMESPHMIASSASTVEPFLAEVFVDDSERDTKRKLKEATKKAVKKMAKAGRGHVSVMGSSRYHFVNSSKQ